MVRRAVIDHNDLLGRVGLADNATNRVVKECGMIIGGDDHRDGACRIQSCTGQSRIHLASHLLLSLPIIKQSRCFYGKISNFDLTEIVIADAIGPAPNKPPKGTPEYPKS